MVPAIEQILRQYGVNDTLTRNLIANDILNLIDDQEEHNQHCHPQPDGTCYNGGIILPERRAK